MLGRADRSVDGAGDGRRAAGRTAHQGPHGRRSAWVRDGDAPARASTDACPRDLPRSTSSAPAAMPPAVSTSRRAPRCSSPRMGVRVVKHGNRSVSSRSGSADLLECLGLPLPLDEKRSGECLAATGFTFLFAPHYHPAMKEIAPVRRALGVRTVFNLLGPLTNPAEPPFGLIGAYSRDAARLMAETLAGMPIERVFVVHGEPGWDEPTPCGPFELYDVRAGPRGSHGARSRSTTDSRAAPRNRSQAATPRTTPPGMRAVFTGAGSRAAPRCARAERGARARSDRARCNDPHAAISAASAALDRGDGARLLERLADFGATPARRTCVHGTARRTWPSSSQQRVARGARRRRRAATCARACLRRRRRCRDCSWPRGFDVIAELKLRSPSLGDLSARTRRSRRPSAQLRGGGRRGLLDPDRADALRRRARRTCELAAAALAPFGVPAMRKDFLVDPYQVLEARAARRGRRAADRAHGAARASRRDARLRGGRRASSCCSRRSTPTTWRSRANSRSARARPRRAGADGPQLPRPARRCRSTSSASKRCATSCPPAWPAVAESGVTSPADAATVAGLGYRLALVGTALMQRRGSGRGRARTAARRGRA